MTETIAACFGIVVAKKLIAFEVKIDMSWLIIALRIIRFSCPGHFIILRYI